MAIDITGIILIALFFIRGYMKGLIVALFSVLAIILGLLVSLKLSQTFATWLLEKGYTFSGWAPVLSYVILFVGVVIVVNLIAKLLQKTIEGLKLGIINKLAGGMLYAFLGLLLWSSLLWLGNQMHAITPLMIAQSKTYTTLSLFAPWFFDMAGKMLPFVKDTFSNLQQFFITINQKQA